jgi:PKD repeat protein
MKKLLLLMVLLVTGVTGVWAQCAASFTIAATPNNNNLFEATLTNTSTFTAPPPPAQAFAYYTVNWGDGSPLANVWGAYATHNYTAPGAYTVTLNMEVTDSLTQTQLCTSTYTQTVNIVLSACATTFSSVYQGGGTYQFTATNPAGTSGMSYVWDFGDGSVSTFQNPSHSYATGGTYTVTLAATGGGCTYTTTGTAFFSGAGLNCSAVSASFYSSTSGLTGYFMNTSTMVNNPGNPISRVANWNFGDGSTSNQQSPSHTYGVSGSYTVLLTTQWVDSLAQVVLCTDTETAVVTVSAPIPVDEITGYISWDSINAGQLTLKVWLIVHDAVANTLTAVDSVNVTGWPWGTTYSFTNPAAGTYLTKAAVVSGTNVLLPTYHNNEFYWSNAASIVYSGSGSSSQNNIYMLNGTPGSGPGFVGGSVLSGANKGTAEGDPIADLLIVLKDASDNVIKFTYTDAQGNYTFSNVPVGTYTVFPEAMNYITIESAVLNVATGSANFGGVNFKQTQTHIKPIGVGVESLPEANLFSVYPNPSHGIVKISWTSNNSTESISITDVTGRNMYSAEVDTRQSTQLNLSHLQPGVYFIKVSDKKASHTERVVIQ